MSARLELLVAREDRRILLRSPEVGFFTHALPAGSLLGPGAHAGVLRALGKSFALAVPAGVQGRVTSAAPELVQLPVGYGTVLYELDPLEAGAPDRAEKTRDTESARNELVFRAPYSGRFWQRPSPHDPPFVRAGDVIGDGQTIGLIEVMKTFTHLAYHADGVLPARARIARVCADDGAEIADGTPLLELEEE